jgi:hypothetical protein
MKEFLAELDVRGDVLEHAKVKFNHHVHGGICTDRVNALNAAEFLESVPRGRLQLGLHVTQIGISHLLQNAGESSLNDRSRMKLDHCMFVQVIYDLIEVPSIVVDDGPAKSPAWQGIDLRDSTSANDRHFLGQISH